MVQFHHIFAVAWLALIGALTPAHAEPNSAPVIGNGTVTPQRILSDYGGAYHDPRLHAKLAIILSRLRAASGRPNLHYRITILNSPTVSPYVLPKDQLYEPRRLPALTNHTTRA